MSEQDPQIDENGELHCFGCDGYVPGSSCHGVKIGSDVARLQSENARLRSALQWFVDEYERGDRKGYDAKITPRMAEVAKEALDGKREG